MNLSMNPLNIIEISKGLLTPLIAIVMTYIAWQQWKTNKQKLKLDRYDRMLLIYKEVIKLISIIIRDGDIDYIDLQYFRVAVSEADFLFKPEIGKYINDLNNKSIELRKINDKYKKSCQGKQKDYNHSEIVDNTHELLTWFSKQPLEAKSIFSKYLNIWK